MSTLTDRYVHAVTRRLPEAGRQDVGRELRATIADAVEAASPDVDQATAEREAIIALGDPGKLAAGYRGRPAYLIGPDLYPIWARVTRLLLGIVPVVAAVATLVSRVVQDPIGPVGPIVTDVLGSAFFAAAQVVFWTVLGFAVAERSGADLDELRPRAWNPDDLEEPEDRRIGWGEVVAQIAGTAALLGLLAFANNPIVTVDGRRTPVFTETFWQWRWLLIAVLAAMVAHSLMTAVRGRWTLPLAHANLLLQAAFAVPTIWLLMSDRLLVPAVLDALSGSAPTVWQRVAATVIGVVAAWSAVDGYRRAGS